VARPVALAVLLLFVLGAASALAYFPREGGSGPGPYSSAATAAGGATGTGSASDGQGQAAAGAQTAASNDSPEVQQLERYLDSSPKAMIPVDVSAPVIIVKFNDYQCPPCKQTYDLYKPLHEKWDREAPGKVKWVIKNFPLEPECNATVQRQVHQFACEAAAGVLMAKQHNKGEALEDWIFANQPTLTLESLKQAIRDIGAVSDYDTQYPRVLGDIKADAQLGGLLGVGSTPTFFFNGVKIPPQAPDVMDALIAYALKKATK
jgi:protein-disulfide isomerase